MNFVLKNSIGVMLLRFVFGCYLVVTIVVTATQLYFEYVNVEKEVVSELHNIGRSFEDGLASALWTLDADVIKSILAGVQKIGIVSGAKVTNQDDAMEGGVGIYGNDVPERKEIRTLKADDIEAKEVVITPTQGVRKTYYEYQLKIFYNQLEGSPPLHIGYAYIYVPHDAVVNRFKDSLYLILINAIIKTSALWVIFLYFSRRFISRPLMDLTKATAALSGDAHDVEEVSERLEGLANTQNRNEVQHLAESFLIMRRTVLDKIENLNTLNHFAVALTQTKKQGKLYERLFSQLSRTFGLEQGVVFNEEGDCLWSSGVRNQGDAPENIVMSLLNEYQLDVIRGRHEISYRSIPSSEGTTASVSNVLYIPLEYDNGERVEMWLLGDVVESRLIENNQLNDESNSFLQVISNMVSATLTSIVQRQTIEQQNLSLESRVLERTKELAKANEELMHMAVHDPLTHLPNRTLFNDRLHHMIDVAERENQHFAVASIDLTEFKQVNDSYGHDAGDVVLLEVGRRLSAALRKSDTIARMGGDEFAAILAGDNIESSVETVVGRLIEALQDPIVTGEGESLLANANIGIALFPDHGTDAEVLFKYADIAMYQAKRAGQGYAIFDQAKNSREKDYLQFMYELEHAIERDQLRLHFQPIVDLRTGIPISFEALLRWEHPERGLVPPGTFIPHAERTALIKPITLWAMREAAKQCAHWHADGIEAAVSINLSARIFNAPELPEQLRSITEEFNVDPHWIKLEITESAAMANPERALSIISNFSEQGFSISLDDFGTGHSSLSYLTRFPLDELKIDRSFIVNRDNNSQVVIRTVIELAHTLKFYVVAEGIEDRETLESLKAQGCDAVQGYYICRPDTVETIEGWYQRCDEAGGKFLSPEDDF